jgi:hypothetical protein
MAVTSYVDNSLNFFGEVTSEGTYVMKFDSSIKYIQISRSLDKLECAFEIDAKKFCTPGLNFTNILRSAFLYKIFS